MTPVVTGWLVGLGWLAGHVVITLVWLRWGSRPSPVARHLVSALVTHLVGVGVAARLGPGWAYWPAAAVHVGGVVAWAFVFCAVYKSVSLRVLTELARQSPAGLPLDRIAREIVGPEYAARFGLLVQAGYIVATETGYRATAAGDAAARRLAALRAFWGLDGDGLYGPGPADQADGR